MGSGHGGDLSETYLSADSPESSLLSEYWESRSVGDVGMRLFAVPGTGGLTLSMNPEEQEASVQAEATIDAAQESNANEGMEAKVEGPADDGNAVPAPGEEDVAPEAEEPVRPPRKSFSKKVSNMFSSFSRKEKLQGASTEEKQAEASESEAPSVAEEQAAKVPGGEPELEEEVAEAKGKASMEETAAGTHNDEVSPEGVSVTVNPEETDSKGESKQTASSPLEVHNTDDQPAQEPAPVKPAEVPQASDVPPPDCGPSKDPLEEGFFSSSPAAIAAALNPNAEALSNSKRQKKTESGSDAPTVADEVAKGEDNASDAKQVRRTGSFLQNIFGFGSRSTSRTKDAAANPEEPREPSEDVVEVGYGLTKRNIVELGERIDAALQDEGKSMGSLFTRSYEEFSGPVEYFLAMEVSFSADETAPGIIESLALELGEEHAMVTKLKRRHNLGQIEQVDAYVRESLDKKEEGLSETIFKEKPEDYATSAEYYVDLEKKASDMGHSLVPLLTDKLGGNHPIVKVLAESKAPPNDEPGDDLQDEFVDVELTQTSAQELPVSEGGVLSTAGMEINPGTGKEPPPIVRDESDTPSGFCGGCICLGAKT